MRTCPDCGSFFNEIGGCGMCSAMASACVGEYMEGQWELLASTTDIQWVRLTAIRLESCGIICQVLEDTHDDCFSDCCQRSMSIYVPESMRVKAAHILRGETTAS